MKIKKLSSVAAVFLAVAVTAAVVAAQDTETGMRDRETTVAPDPRAMSEMFVEIAEKVGPSVVTINSRTTVVARYPSMPGFRGPFGFDPWKDFFGSPREQEYTMTGVGSGVIVSSDGLILTNHHVVGEADEFEVVLQNGEKYGGRLVGTDPETDLALIRIDAEDLPAIELGDSDELRVGQWVVAVGSPFALSQTVTQGIVSYLGRSGVGLAAYENYIQTDAAINPGNSGGALVDLDGRLVGINTAIASRSGGYQGIGFAIPVNVAVGVMEDLLADGYVRRGWLGITIQKVTPELAERFGMNRNGKGILIADVFPDTPADEYGLERGDIITAVNGREVSEVSDFRNMIAGLDPGSRVTLDVFRGGGETRISVVLGERETGYSSPPAKDDFEDPGEIMGWSIEELDRRTADYLGDRTLEGVLVTGIEPGGRADEADIRAGDVILEIEGVRVTSPVDVKKLTTANGKVLLLIWRNGHTFYVVV